MSCEQGADRRRHHHERHDVASRARPRLIEALQGARAALEVLIDEALGHAVGLRDTLYDGADVEGARTRAVHLVDVLNRLREGGELSNRRYRTRRATLFPAGLGYRRGRLGADPIDQRDVVAVLLGVVVAGVEQALARWAETDDRSCANMSNLPVMWWIVDSR